MIHSGVIENGHIVAVGVLMLQLVLGYHLIAVAVSNF
jgi:hypothetical protein